jgi:hypothetical protein
MLGIPYTNAKAITREYRVQGAEKYKQNLNKVHRNADIMFDKSADLNWEHQRVQTRAKLLKVFTEAKIPGPAMRLLLKTNPNFLVEASCNSQLLMSFERTFPISY